MTKRDNYLDAIALMQARVNQDSEATETIVHNTDPEGLVNALVDLALSAGSAATQTPGDPTSYLEQIREHIDQHPDITDE